MPTNLPVRSFDSTRARKRGVSRAAAVLMVWAMTMIALTIPVETAHTASPDRSGMVPQ